MCINLDSLPVPAITGFIAGLLASIFATGVRKMLAPVVFRHKLHIGDITKCEQSQFFTYWYVPIEVKASGIWKLAVSNIEDVRATISYIESGGEGRTSIANWIEPRFSIPSINLQIGGIYTGVWVATMRGDKQLVPLDGQTNESFLSDQDISLELNSGHTFLGRWVFLKAVVEGCIKEVSPTKK